MAYTPTNWQDYPDLSTAITAARLNNAESGIVAAYVKGAGGLTNADIDPAAAIIISKLAGYPGYGTVLPVAPINGQTFTLVDSVSAPTYSWQLMYSSTATAWVYIGGASATSYVETSESTTSTTDADLATVGPSFTIPRAGTYLCAFGSLATSVNSTVQAITNLVKNGATVSGGQIQLQATSAQYQGNLGRFVTVPGLAVNDVVKLMYKCSSINSTFAARWLTVTPVSVT